MKTKIIKIDREHINPEDFREAGKLLREGKLVAFPTETVYGLGGNALDESAAKRIYEAKGRPSDNPLIIHIKEISALEVLAVDIPKEAYLLAERFWPGPLTMILNKSSIVPDGTTGGLKTVAIRMPSDSIALTLLQESGVYIAAPSANASGRPSTTCAEHVIEDLDGKIDMIIDGGAAQIGLESTIIDLTCKVPTILRPGFVTKKQLEDCIGTVVTDKAVSKRSKSDTVIAKAPGMKYKHYAPKGDLTVYEGESNAVVRAINQQIADQFNAGSIVGVIATDETMKLYQGGIIK